MSTVPRRECGGCMACCTTHEVKEVINKPENTPCIHCQNGGCALYPDHPAPCQEFRCEWLKGYGGQGHRPDRLGVVLDYLDSPDLFFGSQLQIHEYTPLALETGAVKFITRDKVSNGIVVVHTYSSGRRKMFLPPNIKLNARMEQVVKRENVEVISF